MSARVFDFTDAIVRLPGHSVVNGLRQDPAPAPAYDAVVREHEAYVTALRGAGIAVEVLPPLEAFPDSVFVEDPALVVTEGAVLLHPGAPSRAGERLELRPILERRFERVLELGDDEFADGGDILITPETVFVGLSGRTNRKGAEAVMRKLAALGREAQIVQTPDGVLHLKSAVSLLAEDMVLATEAMAASGIFAGFDVVRVPENEEAAANALRVNDRVLVGAHFDRTIELLERKGFDVHPLPVAEIGKLDAGLSCMSLRWRTAGEI